MVQPFLMLQLNVNMQRLFVCKNDNQIFIYKICRLAKVDLSTRDKYLSHAGIGVTISSNI